jgi:hypothetical protein
MASIPFLLYRDHADILIPLADLNPTDIPWVHVFSCPGSSLLRSNVGLQLKSFMMILRDTTFRDDESKVGSPVLIVALISLSVAAEPKGSLAVDNVPS